MVDRRQVLEHVVPRGRVIDRLRELLVKPCLLVHAYKLAPVLVVGKVGRPLGGEGTLLHGALLNQIHVVGL